ncbi:polyphosphate kinase 2 family protein [Undibacterium sp. CY18W]|uniref:Polyphosphate kinase 2 family protein n=1 Tax=Undibacterium hunanense TaxID=2762292 RepID=A0ABR6ZKX7_9BURK|nr:PPK2 family polyphosphate kinase [Undibacterium hunanense]MBC3916542.1 polyphosphate kinase 2 family protein [Undibacterium hunanense]
MSIAEQFRITKAFQIKEANAKKKLLGAAADDKNGGKAADKQATLKLAEEISDLQNLLYAEHDRKLLIILQGMDTAGKDGTVKGVFGQINPLGARTVAFKAPGTDDKNHDYLWRVHREVPGKGEITIFNRSHYEDVLITRVHDWIDVNECKRRYAQICDFERMLAETGTVILKFFLHISKTEQKARLEERLADPDKHWKFDPQDLAERKYWDAYQQAYENALLATDADHAPWYAIPADSKTQRNLVIASIVQEKMQGMKLKYPPGNPEFAKLKVE